MNARLTARFVVRFTFMALCALGALVCLVSLVFFDAWWFALPGLLVCAALVAVRIYDLRQTSWLQAVHWPPVGMVCRRQGDAGDQYHA